MQHSPFVFAQCEQVLVVQVRGVLMGFDEVCLVVQGLVVHARELDGKISVGCICGVDPLQQLPMQLPTNILGGDHWHKAGVGQVVSVPAELQSTFRKQPPSLCDAVCPEGRLLVQLEGGPAWW